MIRARRKTLKQTAVGAHVWWQVSTQRTRRLVAAEPTLGRLVRPPPYVARVTLARSSDHATTLLSPHFSTPWAILLPLFLAMKDVALKLGSRRGSEEEQQEA
jgi:hypothetical protein